MRHVLYRCATTTGLLLIILNIFLFQILFSNDQLQQQIAGLVISQQESAHYTEQLNAKIQVTLSDLSSIGTMYP